MNPISTKHAGKRTLAANRLFGLAALLACFAAVSATARASQSPDEGDFSPAATGRYPHAAWYYDAIDPNPIGYYPYVYYQGPAFPAVCAFGYYPYPDPHPYAVPAPYGFGYYGYPFGPYYGYPGWPYGYPGWGMGPGYPIGFGF